MKRIWRDALSAVTPYEAGKSLEALGAELGLPSLRRLSANENPLGPPPKVVEALRREAARAHLYPDAGSTELRKAIAKRLGIGADWIIVGNGGDEIISMIAHATFEPGDEILMPHPSFEPYSIEARLAGSAPVESPLRGYETDLDDLDTPDGVALAQRWPRVVSLRTFSKVAGLAGLRVGFLVGQPEAIGWLNRVRAPFNVNRFAQVAAVAALEDTEHLERTRALVLAERPRLLAELAARGAPAPASQANFVLPRVGEHVDQIRIALLKAGMLVRDGAAVGFPGHLRISIGTREDNLRLLEAWDRALR